MVAIFFPIGASVFMAEIIELQRAGLSAREILHIQEARKAREEHWLLFDEERRIVGCHCGFLADVESDCGYGDSVVEHLLGVPGPFPKERP